MADPNRELLERVVRLLQPLLGDFVFVGGCATGLMITDPAATGIRPTNDVDVIADLTSYDRYAALANRLRSLGLTEDTSAGAAACRWRHEDAIVDIMPTDRSVLGFSNSWFASAMVSAQQIRIAGLSVRMVTPAHFIATKLEAFHTRGQSDVITSSDLEDVVLVVDGRAQLGDEIAHAEPPARQFIAREFGALVDNRRFTDSLGGFLAPDRASQQRRPLLEKRLRAIAALQAP